MGPESSSATTSSSPSSSPAASVKRSRDPEDEVYVDNLHSHKRYLSEIMASSLNGLTVGDTLSENPMESMGRSESMMPCLRDEVSAQYSPMSEDSDDSRYYENSTTNTCSSQHESAPTSPVSPYRSQKTGFTPGPTTSMSSYPTAPPPPRQRGSDTEGRFPSSPSDICHSADLRRAALLRSVQMRAQPMGSQQFETALISQESGSNNNININIDVEERSCSYMNYQIGESCDSLGVLGNEEREKPCRTLDMDLKGEESER